MGNIPPSVRQGERYTVKNAPDEEGPPGSVPNATDNHCDKEVYISPSMAITVATKWDV
jgi:hypothetical protein